MSSPSSIGEIRSHDFESDLGSDAFYQNPYPTYERLREAAPVYWSSGWQSWLVTRFKDCDTVLRDASRFSNANRFAQILDSIPALRDRGASILDEHVRLGVANADRPEHTRLRSLMQHGFHPRDIPPMSDYIVRVVDELLDEVDGPEFDLVTALARPLPAIVIADMLGIPRTDRHRFKALIDDTAFHGSGAELATRAEKAIGALEELEDWLTPMIAARRTSPRDDMLSRLVAATERGEILSISELVTTCIVLVRAGQVTTEGLIGNGIAALISHRDQWDAIVNDHSLIPNAVEEMFRYDTSFLRTLRRAVDDVELGGEQVKRGQLVSVMLGAANRDPSRYERPNTFDVTRSDTRHLGLGVGAHFCLGAPLARMEVATAVAGLAGRWPRLSLATGEVEWQRDNVMRAPSMIAVTG